MPLPPTLGRLTFARTLSGDAAAVSALYVDTTTGQYVVVRTLADARAGDPAARDAFRRQAYAGGPVLEAGQLPDGAPYVVAPYAGAPAAPTSPPPAARVHPVGPPPSSQSPFSQSPFSQSSFGHAPSGQPPFGQPPFAKSGYPHTGAVAPHTRRRWPLLVAAAAVLVLVAGGVTALLLTRDGDSAPSASTHSTGGPATGSSSTPSTDPALGPDAPRPGQCRNVPDSIIDALSDDTPTIDCQQTHKAYTFYVGRYQGDKVDNDYAAHECVTRVAKTLGVTEEKAKLTDYTTMFFQPTDAQWAAGARWFRCDLVLIAAGPSLRPLPPGEILLPAPLPDTLAGCMTADNQRTPCDETHAYRAVATWTATGGATPPSDAEMLAQARQQCPAGTTYYTWPGASTWRYGDRVSVCWKPTSR